MSSPSISRRKSWPWIPPPLVKSISKSNFTRLSIKCSLSLHPFPLGHGCVHFFLDEIVFFRQLYNSLRIPGWMCQLLTDLAKLCFKRRDLFFELLFFRVLLFIFLRIRRFWRFFFSCFNNCGLACCLCRGAPRQVLFAFFLQLGVNPL